MTSLKLSAPAKINLCLHILGRRLDGYHNLSMLMEKVNLCDEIVLEKAPSGIELTDFIADIPAEKNLVYQAALFLQKVSDTCKGKKPQGVRIQLTKKIPKGGGLGGGSSDAATVLKGLNQLWELNWPTEKLAEIGIKLGADIPFFLYDGPAKVEGIGEKITPIKNLPKLWIILINPGVSIATPWAYSAWDELHGNQLTQENQSVSFPRTFDFGEILRRLHNDFEEVVIPKFPEIGEAKEKLSGVGAQGVLMSGSGSTVFGLFETKEKRDRAFNSLKTEPRWQVFTAEN